MEDKVKTQTCESVGAVYIYIYIYIYILGIALLNMVFAN